MLLIALASLVGGVFLIFMGTDEQQNHMNENTHSADELEPGASRSNASRRRAQDHENEAFFGKHGVVTWRNCFGNRRSFAARCRRTDL